ncbi:MAG: hypothetical protein BWZ10_01002 [candidate division BRC1 bacterium ADurb.BinA364]|nr:MAG: hypothetical protein BWZ10_01002 [candidate division BRC1 bacterium ADurb.BinA364]
MSAIACIRVPEHARNIACSAGNFDFACVAQSIGTLDCRKHSKPCLFRNAPFSLRFSWRWPRPSPPRERTRKSPRAPSSPDGREAKPPGATSSRSWTIRRFSCAQSAAGAIRSRRTQIQWRWPRWPCASNVLPERTVSNAAKPSAPPCGKCAKPIGANRLWSASRNPNRVRRKRKSSAPTSRSAAASTVRQWLGFATSSSIKTK